MARRGPRHPARWQYPTAVPHAIAQVEVADSRQILRREIQATLGVRVACRRALPVKVANADRPEQVRARVLVNVLRGCRPDEARKSTRLNSSHLVISYA